MQQYSVNFLNALRRECILPEFISIRKNIEDGDPIVDLTNSFIWSEYGDFDYWEAMNSKIGYHDKDNIISLDDWYKGYGSPTLIDLEQILVKNKLSLSINNKGITTINDKDVENHYLSLTALYEDLSCTTG